MHEVIPDKDTNHSPHGDADAALRPLTAHEFAMHYHTYVAPLYRYFYGRVGNVIEAEDLTASTLDKALRNIGSYAAHGTLGAWLFGIARHTLQDHWRRYRPTVALATLVPPLADTGPLPEQLVVRQERVVRLHAWIAALPESQREALTLRYFAEVPIVQIAHVLGRSEGAVKLLIHRALTTLRDRQRQEDSL